MNALHASAVTYSSRFGFSVFPVEPRGKRPLTTHGLKDATRDREQIDRWWSQWRDANVGVVTGEVSGIVVLDVDPRHGGDESLRELEAKGWIPRTPTVLTGGRGMHLYFQHPGKDVRNRAGLRPGLDLRANQGYVVAPPSIHESGRAYHWEVTARIDELGLAPMPEELLRAVTSDPAASAAKESQHWLKVLRKGADVGTRNQAVASLAGHLLRRYVDPEVALELILAWNAARNSPALREDEVVRTVDSIASSELRRRQSQGSTS